MWILFDLCAGKPFEMVVTNPWLDWTGTVDGDSHLLALLKVCRSLLNPLAHLPHVVTQLQIAHHITLALMCQINNVPAHVGFTCKE